MNIPATTWQTVGPFFKIGLAWLYRDELASADVPGEHIEITGCIFDGDGKPVPDAVLELWQANSHGKYAHPDDLQDKPLDKHFTGFGRIATDDSGRFRFTTIKPGQVPMLDDAAPPQAPHINVSICTRGLLRRLVTRIYFQDDSANATDFALNLVESARRATLIATKSGSSKFAWNVVLQGANETVFFDI
jgi:protocatechuate 3,4-dioxygenase alpha subunit